MWPSTRERSVSGPWVVALIAVAVGSISCGQQPTTDAGREGGTGAHADPVAQADDCDSEPGSLTDVAGEPDWRRYAEYRPWTDTSGCLVRIDMLADRQGPGHCDFEAARVITTGESFGARFSSAEDDTAYVMDPRGVFGDRELMDAYRSDAEKPEDAVDTGARLDETELWMDPDGGFLYLVEPDGVQWLPRGEPPLCD